MTGGNRGREAKKRRKDRTEQDATTNEKLYSHGAAAHQLAIGHNRHPIAEISRYCFRYSVVVFKALTKLFIHKLKVLD